MTTADHFQQLIADYYRVTGLLSGAVVMLVTADSDEDAALHARAVIDLSVGVNVALDDLRRFAADHRVLGRDNWYMFLERPAGENLPTPPDAA